MINSSGCFTFVATKTERMERRIKIVWILTIITSLLMLGGQGYWLYNQYCYSVDEYMRSLHEKMLGLEKEEFEKRYALKKSLRNMQLSCRMSMPDSFNTSGSTTWEITFLSMKKGVALADSLLIAGVPIHVDSIAAADTFRVKNVSSEIIFEASSRYTTQVSSPFISTQFDSLLFARGVDATPVQLLEADSFEWVGSYTKVDRIFPSEMEVVYPYNPLRKQIARTVLTIPLDPLIRQMGWQLLGSAFLAVLLLFCLVYQIKTILKQRRIDELRKSFVNTMIHELKRPVQTLKMCIAFLNDKPMRHDERAMDEVVQDAMFELDNLSAYLAKVRDMTRADYENTPLNIRTFDLKETVEKLVRLSNVPADKKVCFSMEFDMETTLVTADPVHIANIVSNLIENAVKYSSGDIGICIKCQYHCRQLTIAVADNGIGIPAAEQGRVFEKFYRGNNLPDCSIPGIGLGLSYVKLLTEAHHGVVTLVSPPGGGTTITIAIPQ